VSHRFNQGWAWDNAGKEGELSFRREFLKNEVPHSKKKEELAYRDRTKRR